MIEIVSKRGGYKEQTGDIYCGRPGPYGNPFFLRNEQDDEERTKVCDQFETWIEQHLDVVAALQTAVDNAFRLFGKCRLVCWCAPRRCHCESYVRRLK